MKKILSMILTIALLLTFSVTSSANIHDTGFSDVDAEAWYAEAVAFCQQNGLMTGTSTTEMTFSPYMELSRAMVVTMLHRAAGTPTATGSTPFNDVESGAWYSTAVTWAAQNDIVTGIGNGLFGTNDAITREQLLMILWNYEGKPTATETASFADMSSVSSWAAEAVAWGSEQGIPNIREGNLLEPKNTATRAETAYMFMNYLSSSEQKSTAEKILVVYFSRTGENFGVGIIEKGNTAIVAEMIAEHTSGTLFEIVPVVPYPIGYEDTKVVATREIETNARPAIATRVENMDSYDTIFIGYPNWYGVPPMIISTFLESYDFSGKTIIPFGTHEGSGLGRVSVLQNLCPDSTFLEGLAVRGRDAQNSQDTVRSTVKNWLDGLNISYDK